MAYNLTLPNTFQRVVILRESVAGSASFKPITAKQGWLVTGVTQKIARKSSRVAPDQSDQPGDRSRPWRARTSGCPVPSRRAVII